MLTDADRIYDVEDLDASEGFIAELFELNTQQPDMLYMCDT